LVITCTLEPFCMPVGITGGAIGGINILHYGPATGAFVFTNPDPTILYA
jgi:hypothetical protein